MAPLFNGYGEPVALGKELARGGEGTIHALASDASLLGKRYHVPPSPEKFAKLAWMVAHPPPGISRVAAWPTGLLYDRPGGQCVGFVMPRVTGYVPLHLLYNTASRRTAFPGATFRFLAHAALNCAIAFGELHARGHLAGDVNESNLLVSRDDATVRFIDCDSFQIQAGARTYLCEVGVPLFTPPELQGQRLRDVLRTPTHECFGLAVLLFQILLGGRHPFTGVYSGPGEMTPERAIREFRFAYGKAAATFQMSPPGAHIPLSVLPPGLTLLFEEAFSPQAPMGGRPDAEAWQRELRSLLVSLKRCPEDEAHPYPGHLKDCPWCQLLVSPGVAYFVSVPLRQTALSFMCEPQDLDPLREELSRLRRLSWPALPARLAPPAMASPPLAALSEAFTRLRQWSALRAGLGLVCCAAWTAFCLLLEWRCGALLVALLLLFWAVSWATLRRRAALSGSHFEKEYEALRVATEAVEVARSTYRKAVVDFRVHAQGVERRLSPVFNAYRELRGAYEAEQRALIKRREGQGREAYLRSLLVQHHAPQGFGRMLRYNLMQAGLHSVYEVLHHPDLKSVPGIGPKRAQVLLAWARLQAREFGQDPSRVLSEGERKALVHKHWQRQHGLRARMEAELAPLRARARELQTRVPKLRAEVEAAQRALAELRRHAPPPRDVLEQALAPKAWEGFRFWAGLVATAWAAGMGGLMLHGSFQENAAGENAAAHLFDR